MGKLQDLDRKGQWACNLEGIKPQGLNNGDFSSIRLGLAENAKADLCVISSNSLRKPYKLAQCCIERVFQLRFQSL